MKQLLNIRLKCLFALVLIGCSATAEEAPQLSASETATCSTQEGGYQERAEPFLAQYCTNCHSSALKAAQRHGAPLDHNFDTEANLRATDARHIVSQLTPRSGKAPAMPPAGSEQPYAQEREQFLEWLQCDGE